MNNFYLLIKKEILEFLKRKTQLILFIIVFVISLVFLNIDFSAFNILKGFQKINPILVVFVLSLFLISQSVFDSCKNDFKNGGTVFLLNMKINVISSAFAKSLISLVIGISIVLLNFHSLSVSVKVYDLIWITLFYIFIGLLSYFFAIISRNASLLIFCADEIIGLAVMLLILYCKFFLLKIFITVILILIISLVLHFVYKCKFFRITLE